MPDYLTFGDTGADGSLDDWFRGYLLRQQGGLNAAGLQTQPPQAPQAPQAPLDTSWMNSPYGGHSTNYGPPPPGTAAATPGLLARVLSAVNPISSAQASTLSAPLGDTAGPLHPLNFQPNAQPPPASTDVQPSGPIAPLAPVPVAPPASPFVMPARPVTPTPAPATRMPARPVTPTPKTAYPAPASTRMPARPVTPTPKTAYPTGSAPNLGYYRGTSGNARTPQWTPYIDPNDPRIFRGPLAG